MVPRKRLGRIRLASRCSVVAVVERETAAGAEADSVVDLEVLVRECLQLVVEEYLFVGLWEGQACSDHR